MARIPRSAGDADRRSRHDGAGHRRAARMRRLLHVERVELLGDRALQFGVPLVDLQIDHRDGHALAGRETRSRISNAECVIRRKPLVNGREAGVETKFAIVLNGWSLRLGDSQEGTMSDLFRKTAIAATAAIAISTTTIAASTPAEAYWRGGGWGWGLAGLAIGTGLAFAATAPYYGGYDDPYDYGYRPYAYGYGYPYGYRRVYYGYGGVLSGLSPGLLWLWIRSLLSDTDTAVTMADRIFEPSTAVLVSIRRFRRRPPTGGLTASEEYKARRRDLR